MHNTFYCSRSGTFCLTACRKLIREAASDTAGFDTDAFRRRIELGGLGQKRYEYGTWTTLLMMIRQLYMYEGLWPEGNMKAGIEVVISCGVTVLKCGWIV